MTFECPHCEQALECDSESSGMVIRCPGCNGEMLVPEPADPNEKPSQELDNLKETLQSNIDRGDMTITQFMAGRSLDGGVELDKSSDSGSTASKVLTAEQGRKYKLGQVVASGGMGAILDAKDVNLRRSVAMKVMLDPEKASDEQLLRFIEEAQVTSQLQHPSIVPIYELGVDASGNVFYTMKFVQGVTLKDILNKIKEDDKKTIETYPLTHLLNIFQRVCDAIAFAHSKKVIHRDLKPENVMVGEYGEVQVMDWGLAKILPRKKDKKHIANKENPQNKQDILRTIDSVRKDEGGETLKTMDGAIMGTPGFMAPEQALGETENLDERSDIYALGAILYNILTLNPPIKGKDLVEILDKVSTGDIPHPSVYNTAGTGKKPKELQVVPLNHIPGLRIPDSLSAVAMKALTLEQAKRYQYVKFLQRDVEKFLGGFATGAEGASIWKQVSLFVRRNKTASIAAGIIFALLIGGSWINFQARLKSEQAEKTAVAERNKAEKALTALKGTTPALIAQTDKFYERQQYDKALEAITYAIEYAPEKAHYHLRQAHLLQAMLKLTEAEKAYSRVLKLDPGNKDAKKNKILCQELMAENKGTSIAPETVCKLFLALRKQNRGAEAAAAIQRITGGEKTLDSFWRNLLEKQGVKFNKIKLDEDGILRELDLKETGITDLTPLKGIPLTNLEAGKNELSDLTPLKGMPLKHLAIGYTRVSDLTPLKGMPLTTLYLISNPTLSDLTPLKGMKLIWLNLHGTKATDLTPLKGMPLTDLAIGYCRDLVDLTPLKGMPLTKLDIADTRVSDLTPLKGMKLTYFIFTPTSIRKGIDCIQEMTTLKIMGTYWNNQISADEFWKKYYAESALKKSLKAAGIECRSAKNDSDGILRELDVSYTGISDLSMLKGMKLTKLDFHNTTVTDLTPLNDMPLTDLILFRTKVSDMTPLTGMKLTQLDIGDTLVNDLSPIRRMPLTIFSICNLKITDLSILEGKKLTNLNIQNTTATDLSPLKGMKLTRFVFTPKNIDQGIDIIRDMTTLKHIGVIHNQTMPPAEFWKKYDAGEFK